MDNRQAQPRSMRMDYPNQKNAMVDPQGRPMPPNGQKPPPATDPRSAYFTPPAAPSYSPNMSQPPQKKRGSMFPLVSLIVLIVVLSGGTFAVWRYVIKPNTVADVVAYKISAQAVPTTVGGSGVIYPNQEEDVQYPESVTVTGVKVTTGQTVTVNQPLMTLDVGQINSQLQLANAKVQAAQQLLNQDTANGNTTHIAGDQQQLTLAQSEYSQLQQQANSVAGGNLTSSIAGVVTQINVNPGETVSANTPLLTIMNETSVVVHAKIPLANMGQVKTGQTATVSASAVSNLTVNGQVTQVVPEADPQTDTFEVWVSIPNTTQQLYPGMSAFVNIQSTASSLAVPRVGVLNQDSNPEVFVVGADGRAHLQSVHVTGRSADFIYVDSGLTAGQEVIVQGLDTLLDNQQIKVNSVEP